MAGDLHDAIGSHISLAARLRESWIGVMILCPPGAASTYAYLGEINLGGKNVVVPNCALAPCVCEILASRSIPRTISSTLPSTLELRQLSL